LDEPGKNSRRSGQKISELFMNALTDEQRKKVAAWIDEGLKLSEIQSRIGSELGLRLTYMDVRFLVDDLKLTPKDIEPPKHVLPPAATSSPPNPLGTQPSPPAGTDPAAAPANGGVSVSVDAIPRPGSMVSGKVTFRDGNKADWYIDPNGRLGLAPSQAGYRPPPADLQEFQLVLEAEISKMGF
jgi:hypothetical protein